jgi:hypothetical protein
MTRTRSALFGLLTIAALAATAGPALAPAAAAEAPTGNRIETPVSTNSPVTGVTESEVSVYLPLPASAGPHPAACDWLSYLRYRAADGPTRSADADRILVAQPGILEGAGAFDSVARDTITAADELGRHLEFWALDRRSNCLEDPTGRQAALAAKNSQVAIDYYYHGTSVDGRTFAGYADNSQLGWLGRVGMEQTVRDEYDLLAEELPSQPLRKQKVLCGGHSLGGIITGFFAEWDFDGNPATTDDAGYQQCGGYFALDTTISTSMSSLSGMPTMSDLLPDPGIGYAATQAALDAGLVPRSIQLPVLLNAETMNVLGIAGVAADVDPAGLSSLAAALPDNANLDFTLRFLFSRELTNFVTGSPAAKDFRLSNDAALGALLDNNSEPLAFLQSAAGFFTGGPVGAKDFPVPHDLTQVPELATLKELLGPDPKAIPTEPNGPEYGWANYDQVSSGEFTDPSREVTDIGELARSLAEQPLDFTEEYFPTKLVTDIYQAGSPQIQSHLLYPNGISANPVINLLGGSGLVVGNGAPPGRTVIAPGYHHLDVLTAAPVQNTGAADPISANLADFATGH